MSVAAVVRLYVYGLDFRTDNLDLKRFFASVGKVVDAYTPLRDPKAKPSSENYRKNKGFAFVEMSTPEEAEAAMGLSGTAGPYGREIVVKPARRRGSE